ncbi:MAG: hypothetical protein ACFCU5_07400 [Pleurocapsa sp.]
MVNEMTAIEEFREKMKAGAIFEALTLAMSEAVELKITTWVATSGIENNPNGDESQPGYRLHTRINLVNGEVENEIGSEFINNPNYAQLQQLHLEQVQQGRETLIRNIESLQAMFTIFNDTLPDMPQNPALQPGREEDNE